MDRAEVEMIAGETFAWIKVKRLDEDNLAALPLEARYDVLKAHHDKETTFLIGKCRQLARTLLQKERVMRSWETFPTVDGTDFAGEGIDSMDYHHEVHIFRVGDHADAAIIYHNEGETLGSKTYWGAYFWVLNGYDGDCDGDLENLKARIEQWVEF